MVRWSSHFVHAVVSLRFLRGALASDPTCRVTEYQSGKFAFPCSDAGGSISVALEASKRVTVASLAAGFGATKFEVTPDDAASKVTAHLSLTNAATGACIVGGAEGCSGTAEGGSVKWTAASGEAPEALLWVGRLSAAANLHLLAEGDGKARLSYTFGSACPSPAVGCSACSAYSGCASPTSPVCDGTGNVVCKVVTTTTTTTTTTRTTTTTTTSTTRTDTWCASSTLLADELYGVDLSNTTCPTVLKEYETCTLVCKEGQALGQFLCLFGRVAGRPVCAERDVQYETVHKITGVMRLTGTLPEGATLKSKLLPDVLQSALVNMLKIHNTDFTAFEVGEPAIKVLYEFVVTDLARATELRQALASLETISTSVLRATVSPEGLFFTRALLYRGISISRVENVIRPTAFQEVTKAEEKVPVEVKAAPVKYETSITVILITFCGFGCALPVLFCIVGLVRGQAPSIFGRMQTGAE